MRVWCTMYVYDNFPSQLVIKPKWPNYNFILDLKNIFLPLFHEHLKKYENFRMFTCIMYEKATLFLIAHDQY